MLRRSVRLASGAASLVGDLRHEPLDDGHNALTRSVSMSYEQAQREPRRSLRVPLTVLVMRERDGQSVDYAINVSCGGMCLQTDRPATPEDSVRLRFRLGPDWAEMAVEAEVVWCIEAAGGTRFCRMGLHFLDLRDEQRSEIATFVDEGTLRHSNG